MKGTNKNGERIKRYIFLHNEDVIIIEYLLTKDLVDIQAINDQSYIMCKFTKNYSLFSRVYTCNKNSIKLIFDIIK